jgi:hypothetical protein
MVIQKEMKYLYATLTRTRLAIMDNVAKHCYDHIICKIAMMGPRQCGVSREAASMPAETLQKIIFRIWTAIGDSKNYYSQYRPRKLCIAGNIVTGE